MNDTPIFKTCSSGHSEVWWYDARQPCPVCSVMTDLRKVSAQLEQAEQKLDTAYSHAIGNPDDHI